MDPCHHCQQNSCASCTEQGCGGCCGKSPELSLTRKQAQTLLSFSQVPFLPLCRLAGPDGESIPLFLPERRSEADIFDVAQTLNELAALGLITMEYELPLQGYDYAEYNAIPLSAPILDRGSMALTPLGIAALDQIEMLL